jgi:hypothetical protein
MHEAFAAALESWPQIGVRAKAVIRDKEIPQL